MGHTAGCRAQVDQVVGWQAEAQGLEERVLMAPLPLPTPTSWGLRYSLSRGSQVAQMVKNPPANARDSGLIPVLGRSPGEGNDNSLQYSCLVIHMERGSLEGYSSWGHSRA